MDDHNVMRQAIKMAQAGLADDTIAVVCGVSISAVREWCSERRSRPVDGRIKSTCPWCFGHDLNRPAYAYLLGLYLGDGSIMTAPGNKGVFRMEIACGNAWPGLIEEAATAVAQVMPGLKVGRRRSVGCVMVGGYSKHWPCLFPQHGAGRKHTRKIRLADWQQEIVDEHTEELVRGLLHSDGCRHTNRVRRPLKDGDRWYEYPRYEFTNKSADIMSIYTDALDRLGISWRRMNWKSISVARREAVARLDEFVGPKY